MEQSLDFTGTANDVALIYDVGRSLTTSAKWPILGRQRVQALRDSRATS
jgi:hypothetical protein